jgi:hypothetical protein
MIMKIQLSYMSRKSCNHFKQVNPNANPKNKNKRAVNNIKRYDLSGYVAAFFYYAVVFFASNKQFYNAIQRINFKDDKN